MKTTETYSTGEELANSITHGVGLLMSVAGLSLLVVFAGLRGTAWHVVSCSIFGTALVLLYASSTLYHSCRNQRLKDIFKVIDHSSIYILIAGTYTPFTLVSLRGAWGWALFGLVWGLALLGIVFKIFWVRRFPLLSILLYLLMGWLAIIAIKPIFLLVSRQGVFWLVGGGIAYTVGVIFYSLKKIAYTHAVWHVFVLAGSLFHFLSVLFYVVP